MIFCLIFVSLRILRNGDGFINELLKERCYLILIFNLLILICFWWVFIVVWWILICEILWIMVGFVVDVWYGLSMNIFFNCCLELIFFFESICLRMWWLRVLKWLFMVNNFFIICWCVIWMLLIVYLVKYLIGWLMGMFCMLRSFCLDVCCRELVDVIIGDLKFVMVRVFCG